MDDDDWRRRWEDVIARIRGGVPTDVTPEATEADVTAAREEVRRERRARVITREDDR